MLSEATNPDAVAQRKRLYWHSRRGMWELDLLLIPFLEHCYDDLDEADQASYRALIEEEDQDLFGWLMRREPPPAPAFERIVQLIQAHAENADNDPHRPI
jgi:antitoxin CptB